MALMWGWGPLAIHPTGEEVAAAARFRKAWRDHCLVLQQNQDPTPSLETRVRSGRDFVRLMEKRVCELLRIEVPRGGEATVVTPGPVNVLERVREPLVARLLAASLTQSLLNIEYELRSAELKPSMFPTKIEGPAFWEASGCAKASSLTWEAHGFGMSEKFDPADPHAVEAEFLVAAARAYVDSFVGIVPAFFADGSPEN